MTPAPFDLKARARRAMLEAGFWPDVPAEVTREVQALKQASPKTPGPADPSTDMLKPELQPRDLRSLLWSSIDNDSSRDLDQVEYVEKLSDGAIRLLVGIADVDASVAKASATDGRAASESTSVYTGVTTFAMLPGELSTDLTSLLDGQDRLSLVIELRIQDSGEVSCHDLYPAWLRNRAKLAYSSTGAWLEGRGPVPPAVANTPGMEPQLHLQHDTAEKLRGIRKQHGALTFGSVEATPVVENGEVKDLAVSRHNVAEDIIESFMVAANIAMAQYLREKRSLSLRRVVRTPRRWDRIVAIAAQFGVRLPSAPDPRALSEFLDQRKVADPARFPDLSLSVVKLLGPGEYIVEPPGAEHEGHFGLATHDYTHSTAPNRRYSDLVTQRLLKAAAAPATRPSALDPRPSAHGPTGIEVSEASQVPVVSPPSPPLEERAGERRPFTRSAVNSMAVAPCPYSLAELDAIAAHCTEREDAARKVERLMRKVAAASLLRRRIGEIFDGIVTGMSPKGTYVRLLKFPAEGRVFRGAQGIDVGDTVRVRLASVDVDKGFIDFDKA